MTVDATAPVTTASLSPPAIAGIVAGPSATVTLSAGDGAGAGVASTSYSVDAGSLQAYTRPVVVTGNGVHTVHYFSTDAVGNAEAQHTLTFTLRTAVTPKPKPAFTALSVKSRQTGAKISGSLVVTHAGSTMKLTLRIRAGKKPLTIGTATVRRLKSGRRSFTVTLDHAHGVAAQRAHRTLSVTLTVSVTPPGGAQATTATRTVALSRPAKHKH